MFKGNGAHGHCGHLVQFHADLVELNKDLELVILQIDVKELLPKE
jgi:hypothetical protein